MSSSRVARTQDRQASERPASKRGRSPSVEVADKRQRTGPSQSRLPHQSSSPGPSSGTSDSARGGSNRRGFQNPWTGAQSAGGTSSSTASSTPARGNTPAAGASASAQDLRNHVAHGALTKSTTDIIQGIKDKLTKACSSLDDHTSSLATIEADVEELFQRDVQSCKSYAALLKHVEELDESHDRSTARIATLETQVEEFLQRGGQAGASAAPADTSGSAASKSRNSRLQVSIILWLFSALTLAFQTTVRSTVQHLIGIDHKTAPPPPFSKTLFWQKIGEGQREFLRPTWDMWASNSAGWVSEVADKIKLDGWRYHDTRHC